MNTKRTGILMVLLFAAGFMMNTACTPTETTEKEQPKVEEKAPASTDVNLEDKSGKEYTSAYVCPMHCEGSGSDAAGKCPVCNMDYVANEKAGDTHDHEGHGHEGHDHGDHDHDDHAGHDHG